MNTLFARLLRVKLNTLPYGPDSESISYMNKERSNITGILKFY